MEGSQISVQSFIHDFGGWGTISRCRPKIHPSISGITQILAQQTCFPSLANCPLVSSSIWYNKITVKEENLCTSFIIVAFSLAVDLYLSLEFPTK